MTLQRALDLFLLDYENDTTRKGYAHDLGQFIRLVGDCPAASVTPEMVKRWRADQHQRGMAQPTINGRIAKVKRFFAWMVEAGEIRESPARSLHIKKQSRTVRDKAAPRSLLDRMVEAAARQSNRLQAARDSALLGMLIEYGVRRGDAVTARLSRLNDTHFVLRTKGGNEHAFPITRYYRGLLDAYLSLRTRLQTDHDYLFVSIRAPHQAIKAKTVEKIIRALSLECGGNIGPHAIRHAFGQASADAHVPPTITQAVMGHSDVRITMEFYYNQGDDRILAALEALSYGRKDPPQLTLLPRPKRDADQA